LAIELSLGVQDPTDRCERIKTGLIGGQGSSTSGRRVVVVVGSSTVVVVVSCSTVVVVSSSSVVGTGRRVVVVRNVARVVAGATVVGATVELDELDVEEEVELVGAGAAARVVAGRLARSTLVGGLSPATTSNMSMRSERAPRP
jgi:hypothetical protein